MGDKVPWFRLVFGSILTSANWKGHATIGALLLMEALLAAVTFQLAEGSLLWWVVIATMISALAAFLLFAFLTADRG